ncbi:hypothetical protein CDL12_04583 [Handroanthus impetiginosus]|uniref:Uncharacterized protein n=1 Tax=Handroanthus impetiginosus TaxID=429701 RepID=A0A2G9HYW1_9LAMI|nr:hypothetical protein CDL12_04583 [Handroanthus impetiginosus]
MEKEAIINENLIVDSVFIDLEQCADELPATNKRENIGLFICTRKELSAKVMELSSLPVAIASLSSMLVRFLSTSLSFSPVNS